MAWWSLDTSTALRFAQRLQRDGVLRKKVAEGVGVDLPTFDSQAPEALSTSHGIGMFPETERVANALRTGNAW